MQNYFVERQTESPGITAGPWLVRFFGLAKIHMNQIRSTFKSLVTKNALVKEFLHLCSENRYFLKMRMSENRTTEISMSQEPGVYLSLPFSDKQH